jgi:DNA-binding MarR family transcriptional regulator
VQRWWRSSIGSSNATSSLRKRSTADRRRQELYLTPAGRSTLRNAKACIAKHEDRFVALFTAAELESLLAALQKLQHAG